MNRYLLGKPLTLKESEVGATEFVCDGSGFTGVIKHRISDFHVNEIASDGSVSKLTDIDLPKPPKPGSEIPADSEALIKLITQEKFDEIKQIADGAKDKVVQVIG